MEIIENGQTHRQYLGEERRKKSKNILELYRNKNCIKCMADNYHALEKRLH